MKQVARQICNVSNSSCMQIMVFIMERALIMRPLLKLQVFKRLVCVVLAVVLLGGFVSLKTEAAGIRYTYKIITLKQNRYVTAKDYYWTGDTKTQYLYKITIPANGYITIQTNDSSNSFRIQKTYKKNKSLFDTDSLGYCDGYKTNYMVLPKGVYYIYAVSVK